VSWLDDPLERHTRCERGNCEPRVSTTNLAAEDVVLIYLSIDVKIVFCQPVSNLIAERSSWNVHVTLVFETFDDLVLERIHEVRDPKQDFTVAFENRGVADQSQSD